MIEYIKGDLLLTDCKVIVHGCNAQGVMGSGVALQIRNKYPKAYDSYRELIAQVPEESLLGCTDISEQDDGKTVINAITQLNYGNRKVRYVSYDAIDECFEDIAAWCELNSITEIAMPKIGAGLGGGNWEIIKTIIEQAFPGVNRFDPEGMAFNVTVKVYELD